MEKHSLNTDAKALEEAFFAEENRRLLAKIRERTEKEERRAALQGILKVEDSTLLDRLVDLELSPETAVALALVPLVEVAWADGSIDSKERHAILHAAEEDGLEAGSTARELLEAWLRTAPPKTLLESWSVYIRDLTGQMGPDSTDLLRSRVLDRARRVAEAAGGFLGIGQVSAAEKRMLEELGRAFE